MCHDMMQNLERNRLVVSKLTWGIWQILTWALESLKNFHFNGLLLSKVYIIWAKKYRGVIFDHIEEICKIWRKTDVSFGKWHEKFDKFSPEHLKVSEFGLWWDPFVQSRKGMTSKFTEELCVMTMNNTKFYEELNCHFKTDMSFDWILTRALKNLKKLLFNWLLWSKYIIFELRKVQRSYVWWHWWLMQNLKEKWLVLSRMTWGIWQICIGWNRWIANLTKLFTYLFTSLLFLDLRYT